MKLYSFNALVSRMKYIARWGLMRSSRTETLCEHTADTAIVAHTLASVAKNVFGMEVSPEKIAVAALYHDAPEILTGDMPTPVKYKNNALKNEYKALENEAANALCRLVPEEIKDDMQSYLLQTNLTPEEKKLLKAADRISALIKCIEEEQSGNREFVRAKEQQLTALVGMNSEVVQYFIEHMLPCYEYNLDELTHGDF
ncbi:MAG: 5'-deoxynucleotidase [Oscillospiraceae bacterium]